MMPVHIKTESNQIILNNVFGTDCVEDVSGTNSICERLEQITIVPKAAAHSERTCDLSLPSEENIDLKYVDISNCCNSSSAGSFICLTKSEQFFEENFKCRFIDLHNKYTHRTLQDLQKLSVKELQFLLEDLSQSVERVSNELVQLLLENDALQQESDARNIAIEQLLKMTVKFTESDSKPIQMSVILPDEDSDF